MPKFAHYPKAIDKETHIPIRAMLAEYGIAPLSELPMGNGRNSRQWEYLWHKQVRPLIMARINQSAEYEAYSNTADTLNTPVYTSLTDAPSYFTKIGLKRQSISLSPREWMAHW